MTQISKIVFVVKVRLDPKREFKEIGTRSRWPSLKEAEARLDEWYAAVHDLLKARPEATIEAIEVPVLASCCICKNNQYQGETVWRTLDKVFCHGCALEHETGQGFWDLLGEQI